MSFESLEISVASGQPVELYVLTMGSSIWRMNNSIDEIIYDGQEYHPTKISREAITSGDEALSITMPPGHPFTINYATIAPGQVATLTIYRFHRGDTTDLQVFYKGVVRAVSFTQQARRSIIHVIPIAATFDKNIPDMTYQASCNHVLYDGKCQVFKASYAYVGTPSVATGNVLTVPGLLAAKGAGWAVGGYIEYGTLDFRLVLEQDGDDLTLILPFYENVIDETVNVYAGCDHVLATCISKFNNLINYGGSPYIPTKNIFMTGL
ncbi:MAG: phage BR0599 family protein [Candidatus Peribacteraceae bacterium]|nr:phage BR0599 family protein [Candidatus Peribacteraceae bacterium]